MNAQLDIREIRKDEHERLGRLMVDAYSRLEGFPSPDEQPGYYAMLAGIGAFTAKNATQVLVAISPQQELLGGVVCFGDMAEYGSGGTATRIADATGIRLLAVDPGSRGLGVGKALVNACLDRARERGHARVVLHTTRSMHAAWTLYERIGFERAPDLDFMQDALPVFGFKLELAHRASGAGH